MLCYILIYLYLCSRKYVDQRNRPQFSRAVDIQQELRRHLRQADVPTIKALTMALKAQGFHHGAWVGQRGWYARRRSEE